MTYSAFGTLLAYARTVPGPRERATALERDSRVHEPIARLSSRDLTIRQLLQVARVCYIELMTDMTMRRVDTEDRDGNPINFLGYELGYATSKRHKGQMRWTEVTIFRTTGGTYVLEIVGYSEYPGEVLKQRATVTTDPNDVISGMQQVDADGETYITYTFRECLFQAMEHDPALEAAWTSRSRVVA